VYSPSHELFERRLAPNRAAELVGPTRCGVDKYEKKNKATCVPATF
jgi:hypothetical protein